jgi:RNA polymerase sigma factor (sigma-70 family)
MTDSSDFEALISLAATGNEDAARRLAEAYTPHILRVVRRSLTPQLRQKLDSIDIAQTLWASILLCPSELARFQKPEQLIAFLARASRNKVIDKVHHFNTQKHNISRERGIEDCRDRPDKGLYSTDPSPSQIASFRERMQMLLASCSDEERQVFTMRYFGRSYEEIGLQLSISRDHARRVIGELVAQFER